MPGWASPQPWAIAHIARWNLARLAETLLPLMVDTEDEAAVQAALDGGHLHAYICDFPGNRLKDHPKASIVLIPGAPHTLLNLPAARQVVAGYLQDALK